MKVKLTEAQIKAIKEAKLEKGEALYLIGEEIEVGQDGCQPSNSACIVTGPWDYFNYDTTIEEIEESLSW